MNDKKKVDDRIIEQSIKEYNKGQQMLHETYASYPIEKINGGEYKVVNMSLSDFIKTNKAVKMDDIQWT